MKLAHSKTKFLISFVITFTILFFINYFLFQYPSLSDLFTVLYVIDGITTIIFILIFISVIADKFIIEEGKIKEIKFFKQVREIPIQDIKSFNRENRDYDMLKINQYGQQVQSFNSKKYYVITFNDTEKEEILIDRTYYVNKDVIKFVNECKKININLNSNVDSDLIPVTKINVDNIDSYKKMSEALNSDKVKKAEEIIKTIDKFKK